MCCDERTENARVLGSVQRRLLFSLIFLCSRQFHRLSLFSLSGTTLLIEASITQMVQLRREHAAMLSVWTGSVERMCHCRVLDRWRLLPLFALVERVLIFPKRVKPKPLLSCSQMGRTDRWLVLRGYLPTLVDVLACVLSRFLFVLDDQARFLLSLYCRQDSFERKEKRTLPEVQEEKNLAWKARQRRICSESQDIRYLLNARHDSFLRKERRFLLEVQVEHHVLSLFTRDYIYERLFFTCSFEHNDKEQ